jgi:hypothetical protein
MPKEPNQTYRVMLIELFECFAPFLCVKYMMARMPSSPKLGCESVTTNIHGLKTRRNSPSTCWRLLGNDLVGPSARAISPPPVISLLISDRNFEELLALENWSRRLLEVTGP